VAKSWTSPTASPSVTPATPTEREVQTTQEGLAVEVIEVVGEGSHMSKGPFREVMVGYLQLLCATTKLI